MTVTSEDPITSTTNSTLIITCMCIGARPQPGHLCMLQATSKAPLGFPFKGIRKDLAYMTGRLSFDGHCDPLSRNIVSYEKSLSPLKELRRRFEYYFGNAIVTKRRGSRLENVIPNVNLLLFVRNGKTSFWGGIDFCRVSFTAKRLTVCSLCSHSDKAHT